LIGNRMTPTPASVAGRDQLLGSRRSRTEAAADIFSECTDGEPPPRPATPTKHALQRGNVARECAYRRSRKK